MRNSCHDEVSAARRLLGAVMLAVAINGPSFGQQAPTASVVASELSIGARWIPTGNLNVARFGHTATLLPNGKVLVVGGVFADDGWGDFQGDTSAELYDPATGSWTLTGSTQFARAYHTATLLFDGRVLVVGGVFDWRVRASSAELYNPATGAWTPTGSMHYQQAGNSATQIADGRVVVIHSDATGEVYDPVTGSWNAIAPTTPNIFHTVTELRDGTFILLGGGSVSLSGPKPCDDSSSPAKVYDPRTDTWSSLLDGLVTNRVGHVAMLLPSGKVLVGGGSHLVCERYGYHWDSLRSAELYDPAAGTSTTTDSLKFAGEEVTATQLSDGGVLVTGGFSDTETYDAKGEQWRPAGQQITPRSAHTATLLQDGRVLVAGGVDRSGKLASAELYGNFPQGTIGRGYTGSWYDPKQSGHGLFVEVLPDNRFLAAWFTFDPTGTQQAWFLGVGTYSGDTATINSAVQPTGGRWIPNFDPFRIANNPWGTLKFTFTDCNHGKVEFASSAGYGAGSMNLTRLTQPAGLACP